MVRKHNNQLPENLPQLQNLIKRDSVSYHEEFIEQHQHFQNALEIFQLNPEQQNKTLEDLVMFMAQVAHCYPTELETYPQQIADILEKQGTVINSDMRMTFCRALILLRNKNLLNATDLLSLFFNLLRCQDKVLREFLENHIINDIKNMNAKHKNNKVNNTLQNFMFTMLKDTNARAAKMSVDIMIELYKKNVWNDAKTVNVIASGCFSKFPKVMVASIKFFLEKDAKGEDGDDSSDSDDEIDPKQVLMANKVNKNTRKRKKQLDKVKKLAAKAYKKKSKAPNYNFSALHLIHDPQGMAEKLFKQLEASCKRFEIKILTLDVISRLIGLHSLFLLNFYSYIQRFLQPHQREVTQILQFIAQASHELVPPDVMEPVLKTIANNFITERNSSDVMAIGLNSIREICNRCPLAINEDLLRDLAEYKKYKERSVMMAAKSLINLFRVTRPDILHRKDRGRPTDATKELKEMTYGQVDVKDFVVGAEVLTKENDENGEIEIDSDQSDSDDDEWIDIDKDEAENETNEEEGDSNNTKEMHEEAHKICVERILGDEDFKKIDVANIKKQIHRTSNKRKFSETTMGSNKEFVELSDIENIYKKRKHDKQTRVEAVKSGQADREKFGYKDGRLNLYCSKTNREKRKKKNYQMIKHKVQRKVKRSFKDKQIALRNHLLKLKKMK